MCSHLGSPCGSCSLQASLGVKCLCSRWTAVNHNFLWCRIFIRCCTCLHYSTWYRCRRSSSAFRSSPDPCISDTGHLRKRHGKVGFPGVNIHTIHTQSPWLCEEVVALPYSVWPYAAENVSKSCLYIRLIDTCALFPYWDEYKTRNSHGALRNLAAAQPLFSGLHVSTVSSQVPPALFGTQRWQFRASPGNQKNRLKSIMGQNSICMDT